MVKVSEHACFEIKNSVDTWSVLIRFLMAIGIIGYMFYADPPPNPDVVLAILAGLLFPTTAVQKSIKG